MTATIGLKADQLGKIRHWANLQRDSALAQKMGIDQGNLSRVLRGIQQPGARFMASLCVALDAELGDLFEVVKDEAGE